MTNCVDWTLEEAVWTSWCIVDSTMAYARLLAFTGEDWETRVADSHGVSYEAVGSAANDVLTANGVLGTNL